MFGPNNRDGLYLQNGNFGIGSNNPTTDKLVVSGDIRLGTSGSNGCITRYDGTAIAGTCSSDLRLKKNINSLDNVLSNYIKLQPVTYEWRADEFPDRKFGDKKVMGMIAQDVEQVFPELVSTDGHGFKTVDYGIGLQMLTIESIKELNLKIVDIGSFNEGSSFVKNLKTFLADAKNEISDLFVKKIHTENICLQDESGVETCITKADLDRLLSNELGNEDDNGNGGNPDHDNNDADNTPEHEEDHPNNGGGQDNLNDNGNGNGNDGQANDGKETNDNVSDGNNGKGNDDKDKDNGNVGDNKDKDLNQN